MEFFDSKTIANIATIQEWIDAMGKALQTTISGSFVMPKRMHLDYGKDTFLLMPCITEEYWATKLVSFCTDNKLSGRPSIYGTVVLNDTKTGEPLAIMEGSIITAMRTAAVTATGIKYLSDIDSHSLGIIGTGVQGFYQVLFACSVRNIHEIWAYDLSKQNLDNFEEKVKAKHSEIKINRADNSSQVVAKSEVIISATNSPNPVFENSNELFRGKTFIGIGSYKPDCMEFPEVFFRQLDQIFVDTLVGKSESGDLITPVKNNWIPESSIIPLGSLISGNITLSQNKTKLFKTVGSAIFDLFAAKLIYEKQIKK
jgi:ornithine cyclodeaminase/alanine dehydrogenase-like protein (mu-crystallin family)